ncbi:MAG: sigma-70 family RNA polymerase sigma factor [Propionibacteriales bacterium]|nr:sigma-70 family RNA polymerase sigma factor [Propionibacteriales bacterium]
MIGAAISTDPDGHAADRAALARVLAGDRDAYTDLVRRHAPVAVRTAMLLGAGADAEDVVQEAFVKAYRALGGFRAEAAFRPWLLRIVANETRNLQRATRRRSAVERSLAAQAASLLPDVEDPVASALSTERRQQLLQVLDGLPEPHRQVVVCRYLLDLDEYETATVLGWPRGTVKSRLHRALRRMRARVDPVDVAAHPREVGHGS